MKRRLFVSIPVALVFTAFAIQGAAAAPAEKVDAFICPVLGGQAGEHGNSQAFATPPGGFYTVLGPNVSVPVHATNKDGAGNPADGQHASPGDPSYSAIWSLE
jgi:hypothetical protein